MASRRWRAPIAAALLSVLGAAGSAGADTVTLKNGIIYRGEIDKDNTILTIYDGLKRIVIRDTKVDKILSDANEHFETFPLEQPLTVHTGAMPASVLSVKATPWDEFGRRSFEYLGPRLGKRIRMTQAINSLGPKVVRIRGVDGFWQGQLPTSQVPKASVLAILAKVDPKNQGKRLKVCQFLIQSEWYPEALAELDRLAKDFPDAELANRVKNAKAAVQVLRARQVLAEIEVVRKAQQPKDVLGRLKTFPTEGAPADVLVAVREQLRREENQVKADRALADAVRAAAVALPSETRARYKSHLVEMLAGLAEAADAVGARFEAFQRASDDPALSPEARFARALAGWVGGAKATAEDLKSADALWTARDAIQGYLTSTIDAQRNDALAAIANAGIDLDTLTQVARLMAPPLRDAADEAAGKPKLLRVRGDDNPVPTEYAILLPPEYHPLRSYPVVVALHDGSEGGPDQAARWWASEAARRGYIVVAPQYNLPGQAPDYRYSPSEHAAVELALRDARRRFAIDSDRVFLGGQLLGGNMAWDFGLAHPDLFAGVAVVAGMPAKYVWAYKDNAKRVPFYVAMGDLIPSEPELIFPFAKGLVASNYDMTYVEYYKRGRESLPEEIPPIFDWMDRRVRDAYPKTFEAVTARSCDDRFFGVVVRDFAPGRAVAPEAVDPLGKNLRTATIKYIDRTQANLVNIDVAGIQSLDVWLGPRQVDFTKKFEVRVNRRTVFKNLAKPDFEPFLEDLRIRGDRQQVYWTRITVKLPGPRAQ